MKPEILRLLVCPSCRSGLDLTAGSRDGAEIMEGRLSCRGCRSSFAIRRGVPRFVDTSAYAGSFGRQWNWFRDVQLDSANGTDESERTLAATTGWEASDCAGRLVLDAGVGAGRFAEIAARKGSEVVGIDLTDAVDAAFANVGRLGNVHVIQADMFSMPFLPETFDLAYSIGVLHHTPDPREAFERTAEMVKKGGQLAAYVYAGYGAARWFPDAIRNVTTRMPLSLMLAVSALAGPLYYLYRLPGVGKCFNLVCPISLHRRWRWRWLDTFDWYTPKYQWKFFYPEVYRWFREAGFVDMEIFDDPIRIRGTKSEGARAASLPVPDLATPIRPPRVAALGGGTGMPVVLEGLKASLLPRAASAVGDTDRLTAIVTVADDGGSSGRLRRAYGVLAPGDARNCLLALAEGAESLQALFRFRFGGNGDVSGHNLGNLILTALSEVEGDFVRALQRAAKILRVRGRVLASTLEPVTLVAELDDGSEVAGESAIPAAGRPIRRVRLLPDDPPSLPQARTALRQADLVVLGPGSLYTSVIPTLLVKGLVEAIAQSHARVVLVLNLMTAPGETDGYTASDHLRAVLRHAPGLVLHQVLANSAPIGEERLRRYAHAGASPVRVDASSIAALGCELTERPLIAEGHPIRHDPRRLAAALLELAQRARGRRETNAPMPRVSGF